VIAVAWALKTRRNRWLQVRVFQQALKALRVAGLRLFFTLLATLLTMFYLQPAVAAPMMSLDLPALFWQSKGSVSGGQQVLNAYQNQLSNVIVENVVGVVTRILPDDLEGSRHQRFIMRVAGGHTVLVVHNIDLAARIEGLRAGDQVAVKGEYEWNEQGGLIHWTHRDPRSAHEDGWIDHGNLRYE
jgi:hypothetical protein